MGDQAQDIVGTGRSSVSPEAQHKEYARISACLTHAVAAGNLLARQPRVGAARSLSHSACSR